jgi:multidrug efflux pump subunit AcrA (membrane-fusion protein)
VKAGKYEAAPVVGEALDPNRDFPEKPVEKAVVEGLFAELAAGGKNFPPESPRGLMAKNTHASLELAIKANPKWAEPQAKLAAIETNSIEKMKELKAAATLDPRNASYWQALAEAQAAADDYVNAAKSWSLAEHAAADEAERARIHIAKMALDAARADFTEAEKKRRAEDAARDLERVKAAAAAEVHAAEAAANARMNAGKGVYQKPIEWWDDPNGAKVEGRLTRVECLNGPLRLTIQRDGGASVRVAVRDLKKLTVNGTDGAPEAKFGCGVAKPARKIRLTYEAKPDTKLGTLGDVLVVEFP